MRCYGIAESYLLGNISSAFAFNTELMKVCAMGVTVLVSSGDDGAAGYRYRGRYDTIDCAYDPQFPASSPYVTAVGATMGLESESTEVVCESDRGGVITSGGGFSNIFPAFPQQKSAIRQYLNNTSIPRPWVGYNTSGRGYPDVSLAGKNYLAVLGGTYAFLSGTSASTPAVAGMITLINAARRAAGRPPVGWLNPALYASNGSFANDITVGENTCTVDVCCVQGFYAAAGWDPATGHGSVDFKKLYTLLMSLPFPTSSPSSSPSSTPTSNPTSSPSSTP
eukprot:gene678-biopygen717